MSYPLGIAAVLAMSVPLGFPAWQEAPRDPAEWNFNVQYHLRFSFNAVSNSTDLSSANDDNFSYFAYLHDLSFSLSSTGSTKAFMKMVRATRANYDAPISGGTILTAPGVEFEKYTSAQAFLPRITEYWVDVPFLTDPSMNTRIKAGLFAHVLGSGFAGGKHENYGVSVYSVSPLFEYQFHAEIEDYHNKVLLGPVLDQEKAFAYNDTNAYFFALDARVKRGDHLVQPYVGWLMDRTPNSSRGNVYTTPTNEDNLGTAGVAAAFNFSPFVLDMEYARNFGSAVSSSLSASTPDVTHTGSLLYGNLSCSIFEMLTPRAGFILGSGNKASNVDLITGKLTGNTNNAFSVYSPTNGNLFDTRYPSRSGPFIATGCGHAINYGVSRPTTFSSANLLENLDAKTIGFAFTPMPGVYLSVDYWMLRSVEQYYGYRASNASLYMLSADVGSEWDVVASVALTPYMKINFIGALFTPGEFYKELRLTGTGSPFVPLIGNNGKADPVSQLEIGVEFSF